MCLSCCFPSNNHKKGVKIYDHTVHQNYAQYSDNPSIYIFIIQQHHRAPLEKQNFLFYVELFVPCSLHEDASLRRSFFFLSFCFFFFLPKVRTYDPRSRRGVTLSLFLENVFTPQEEVTGAHILERRFPVFSLSNHHLNHRRWEFP